MCLKTISDNDIKTDEFAAGGFTVETAKTITAPRIKESFLSLECILKMETDLSQKGVSALVIGKVQALALDESFAKKPFERYERDGFMFNVHQPKNPLTADGSLSGVGTINVIKKY